jgi:hypothetical protein
LVNDPIGSEIPAGQRLFQFLSLLLDLETMFVVIANGSVQASAAHSERSAPTSASS